MALTAAMAKIGGGRLSATIRGIGAAVLLACSASVALEVPVQVAGRSEHWSFGLIGWYGLVLLFDVGSGWMVTFLTAHLIVFVTPWVVAPAAPSELARLGMVAVSVTGFQIGVAMTAPLIASIVAAAHAADQARERLASEDSSLRATLQDHERRCRDLRGTAVPLLKSLADGRLDASDVLVRRRCAVEAARIRRLMCAGSDPDPTDPLVEEFRAAVEVAERHGVAVALSVAGDRHPVPEAVRREFFTVVSDGLLTAVTTARVTVMHGRDGVRVSVVSDLAAGLDDVAGPAEPGADVGGALITVQVLRTPAHEWREASWNRLHETVTMSKPQG